MNFKKWILRVLLSISFLGLFACALGVLQYKEAKKLEDNKEYDRAIKVKKIESKNFPKAELKPAREGKKKFTKENKKGRQVGKKRLDIKGSELKKKEPSIEDTEGFRGRRPIKDPFGTNEKIVLSIKYFAISAGEMTFESKNFVEVNNRRSYHFAIGAKTNGFFSKIYKVDNWAETYVDYEKLVPYNMALHVKESKKLKEVRLIYDFNMGKASYWEKSVKEDTGEKNDEMNWDIQPFSQNIISAFFYLRTFTLRKGKKVAFYATSEGKNILITAEVIRQELLKISKVEMDTFVLKIEVKENEVSKEFGNILIWLTNDDRKFLVHMESKLKFGTLVGSLKELHPGRTP